MNVLQPKESIWHKKFENINLLKVLIFDESALYLELITYWKWKGNPEMVKRNSSTKQKVILIYSSEGYDYDYDFKYLVVYMI